MDETAPSYRQRPPVSNRPSDFDFLGSSLSGDAQAGDETIAAAWVPKAAAEEMIDHPGYRQRLRQLLAFDGRVLFQSYTTEAFAVRTQQWV